MTSVQSGRVTTEGDDLYYEVRGQGHPLLMIAGGGGDGWWYGPAADLLSNEYKVITYDRRANARSTMRDPQNFEVSQQSRDAVAVLKAAGETSAFVFGNSSGAVIVLDMAKTQPQAVRAAVVHEPPIARIHPQARLWQRFFANVYAMSFRYGSSLAALRFALGVGLPLRSMIKGSKELARSRKQSSDHYIDSRAASDYLVKQEILPITNYLPDIAALRTSRAPVIMAAGQQSLNQKRFFAQTVPILAEKLGCEMVTFPGHHGSHFDMPNEWSATLHGVLSKVATATPAS